MDSLISEVRTLACRFTSLEAVRKAGEDAEPVAWHSARGMLDIVIACDRISDITTRIAKAGYRECDKEMLAEISAQSRQILYNISDLRRPANSFEA